MQTTDCVIAVLDDNVPVTRALSRALTSRGYHVRTFTSGRDYLDQRLAIHPTCLLADIRMPGMDGLETHRAAHEDGNAVPTIFMTGSGDVTTVVNAMKAGASDLLSKPFSVERLYQAIDTAVGRGEVASAELRSLADLWRKVTLLTPREAEIAALVTSGRLNKQVAARTGITEKTVKVHRARAMRKLHASSLAEMVRSVDRLIAERNRVSLHIDGATIERPAVVDVMARALDAAPIG